MFKYITTLMGAFILMTVAACSSISGFSDPHLYRASTVEVSNGKGHGSGVVLDATHILTANHVVKDAGELEIMFGNGDKVKGHASQTFADLDMAIVEVDAMPKYAEAVKVNCSELAWGEKVTTVGFPMYDKYVASVGIITSVDKKSDDEKVAPYLLSTDASIVPGMSGGPAFNNDGEVVGFIDASMVFPMGFGASFTGIGYIVPASEFCSELPTN